MSTPIGTKPAGPPTPRAFQAVGTAFREWAIFASLGTITSSITHVVPTLFTPYPIDLGMQMFFFGFIVFVVTCPLVLVIFVAVLATPPIPRGTFSLWRTMTRWSFYALAILLGSCVAFFTSWDVPWRNYVAFAAAFIPTAALVYVIERHRYRTATRRAASTNAAAPAS